MTNSAVANEVVSSLDLNLVITDRNVLGYLAQFPDEETQIDKVLEALKVGVIAIQSASPTLDTTVVQSQFAEMETSMREYVDAFQRSIKDDFKKYFEGDDGVVPRSIEDIFGDSGSLTRTFQAFFDPEEGRLGRLMQCHVGPESTFGKSLDPQNKQGVIAVLEARVQELVEAKLDDVLKEFSLDENGSAMFRLHGMLAESFERINRALGHNDGQEQEAKKGHVKGIRFEQELYDDFFVPLCNQCDDDPSLVARTPGNIEGCKTGDLMSTLGEATGAPGVNIVVEVKDREVKLKDARTELQEAKVNRKAAVGIYVWSRGTEPTEVGDFRRIGDDFYVTVDRDDLRAGKPLLYLDAAYRIARAMAVAAVRKESASEIDFSQIEDNIEALGTWSERIADMSVKARTIQKSGKLIEECATDLKEELDRRVANVLAALRHN
ncbi:hypothetical protein AB1L30_10340 [Bremerella sp. JC817]|uniref:hypothetical protein n=1 Tax=Bremerella sp. JC817 TaxID=3231756 RepID=UPI00345AE3E2